MTKVIDAVRNFVKNRIAGRGCVAENRGSGVLL